MPDDCSRHTGDNVSGGDIAAHHGVCTDNGTISDGDTGQQDRVGANPHVGPNLHGGHSTGLLVDSIRKINPVRVIHDEASRGQQAVRTDGHALLHIHHNAGSDKAKVAEFNARRVSDTLEEDILLENTSHAGVKAPGTVQPAAWTDG